MKKRAILLVEDNPSDVKLTQRAIRQNNVLNEIKVVHDGQEALDYLFAAGEYSDRDTGTQPSLILLDLNLPKIDGITVLQRIRNDSRTNTIPIVILTTSNETKDLHSCYVNGCNSYIRKPVDFRQFVKAVSQLGLYWLVLNEPPV